jgi:hypothetical protein
VIATEFGSPNLRRRGCFFFTVQGASRLLERRFNLPLPLQRAADWRLKCGDFVWWIKNLNIQNIGALSV